MDLYIKNDREGGKYHEKIDMLMDLYYASKLTKKSVNIMLASIPKEERSDFINELEEALSDQIENLP